MGHWEGLRGVGHAGMRKNLRQEMNGAVSVTHFSFIITAAIIFIFLPVILTAIAFHRWHLFYIRHFRITHKIAHTVGNMLRSIIIDDAIRLPAAGDMRQAIEAGATGARTPPPPLLSVRSRALSAVYREKKLEVRKNGRGCLYRASHWVGNKLRFTLSRYFCHISSLLCQFCQLLLAQVMGRQCKGKTKSTKFCC